jgi:hypothetical protein
LLQTGRYVDTGSVYVFFLGDHFADIETDAEAYLEIQRGGGLA